MDMIDIDLPQAITVPPIDWRDGMVVKYQPSTPYHDSTSEYYLRVIKAKVSAPSSNALLLVSRITPNGIETNFTLEKVKKYGKCGTVFLAMDYVTSATDVRKCGDKDFVYNVVRLQFSHHSQLEDDKFEA